MSNRKSALIGLGYWGKNILRNLSELNVLKTACDSNSNTLSTYKEMYPDVSFTSSVTNILNDPDIKSVFIATPAVSHYEIVLKALTAGKDVFVEKPLALNVSEGQELVKRAEELDRILMVGHILNFHPAVTELKQRIHSGELGKIQYIYSNRLNIGKLRIEENILWSFAPHDISVILALLNEEPQNIECFGEWYLNENIYDVTMTTLSFSNKVKAHIFVNWLHPYKEQRLVVVGSKSMMVFDDCAENKLLSFPHEVEWVDGKVPLVNKVDPQVIEISPIEPLKAELEHFLSCVDSRKKPITDGQEALRVLKVLESAEVQLNRKRLS